jgi:peroxiredoxin family protein
MQSFSWLLKNRWIMKKVSVVLLVLYIIASNGFSQVITGCENVSVFNKSSSPDMGIVISSGDVETVWNALRLAIAAQSKGDTVVVFVISKAVDVFMNDTSKFDILKTSQQFIMKGGDIFTCATCAKMRHTENVQMCTITSIYDLYEIVKRSKKVVTF